MIYFFYYITFQSFVKYFADVGHQRFPDVRRLNMLYFKSNDKAFFEDINHFYRDDINWVNWCCYSKQSWRIIALILSLCYIIYTAKKIGSAEGASLR